MNDPDFFGEIRQQSIRWQDRSIPIPLFYRHIQAGLWAWAVPTHHVLPLLPSSRLHPLRIAPTRCLLFVSALQHLDTDLGPYGELLIGFPCTLDTPSPQFSATLRHEPPTLMVVHELLVTTDIALRAGSEFLGTRKKIATMQFDDGPDWWVCEASVDGQQVARLGVRKGLLQPVERQHFQPLSVRGERLLRWDFTIAEHEASRSRHLADTQVSWGPHPIGRLMESLEPGPLLECQYTPQMQAVLAPVAESMAR